MNRTIHDRTQEKEKISIESLKEKENKRAENDGKDKSNNDMVISYKEEKEEMSKESNKHEREGEGYN